MPEKVTAVRTVFETPTAELTAAFITNLVKLLISGASAHGFWSGEMMAPCPDTQGKWKLIHRFSSASSAEEWKQSDERKNLLEYFASAAENKIPFHDEPTSDHNEASTAILTDVRPDMLKEFLSWQEKIHRVQAQQPGYRSLYLQAPPGGSNQWVILLQYDSPESIQNWFASPERKVLLEEAEQFVEKIRYHHLDANVFPGLVPNDSQGQSPPSWKTAMLVLLGLFPLVLLEILYFYPLLNWMNLVMRTFVGLILSVALTTFIVLPFLVKSFRWWIYPEDTHAAKGATAKGVVLIMVLYAIQVWLLLLIAH